MKQINDLIGAQYVLTLVDKPLVDTVKGEVLDEDDEMINLELNSKYQQDKKLKTIERAKKVI